MLRLETKEAQIKFTRYCRTGKEDELHKLGKLQHVHHYRRLSFNIIKNTLSNAYPRLKNYLSEDRWNTLMHQFFSQHKCQNNKIWLMPKELYDYAVSNNFQTAWNIPFLNDLMHLEWVEIEVHTMPDKKQPMAKSSGKVWTDVLAINPEFKLIKFDYPVHKKNAAKLTAKDKGLYYLLVYRELTSGKVKFMQVSALNAFIVEQINNGYPLNTIVEAAEELFKYSDKDSLEQKAEKLIDKLKTKGLVTGFVQ